MNRHRPIAKFMLCGVVILGLPLLASEFCPINFAVLSEGVGDGHELVLDAYRRLFDRLGKGRIPAAVLRRMEDPFVLPDDAALGDLSVLKLNLKRLRELVQAKRWDSAELRGLLREELTRQSAAEEKAVQTRREAVGQGPNFVEVMFDSHRVLVYSPDRRWVMTVKSGPTPGSRELKVYDVKESRLTAVPLPDDFPAVPLFIPGEKVALFQAGLNVESVPFHEGTFEWAKRKFQFSTTMSIDEFDFQPTTSPDLFFVPAWGQLYRYDLAATQKVKPVEPPRPAPVQMGGIPGTEKAYFVVQEGAEYGFYEGTTTEEGKFVGPALVARWPVNPGRLYFSADRKKFVSSPPHQKQTVLVQSRGGSSPPQSLVSAKTKTIDFGGEILGMVPGPLRNDGYVFVREAGSNRMRIEKVNFDTNQCVWSHEVSRAFSDGVEDLARVTPDGKQILFRDAHRNLVLINLALIESMKSK